MFSKIALPVALLGAQAAAGPIGRAVDAVDASTAVPHVVFTPAGRLGHDSAARDLSLTTEDNLYWSHTDQGECLTCYLPHGTNTN